jgi:hypothetical protein
MPLKEDTKRMVSDNCSFLSTGSILALSLADAQSSLRLSSAASYFPATLFIFVNSTFDF